MSQPIVQDRSKSASQSDTCILSQLAWPSWPNQMHQDWVTQRQLDFRAIPGAQCVQLG
jgi:hypothetical protein